MTSQRKPKQLGEPLTTRELDVLRCAADGLSTEQTAANLGVTLQTIKFHRTNLMARLGATSIAHAVGIGFRTNLLADRAPADAGGSNGAAMSLEDVAIALSELAANVLRIADATEGTDDRMVAPVEEPDADAGVRDGTGALGGSEEPRSVPRSIYAPDR